MKIYRTKKLIKKRIFTRKELTKVLEILEKLSAGSVVFHKAVSSTRLLL